MQENLQPQPENEKEFWQIEMTPELKRIRHQFVEYTPVGDAQDHEAQTRDEAELKQLLDTFYIGLQNEAERRFGAPYKDLWFHYQLIQAYIDAKLWAEALDLVEDTLYVVADQYGEGHDIFEQQIQVILERRR